MTLVVGIKCHEGIVIGADSITTFGSAIEQEVDDKIKIINNEVLVASAGDVGLAQAVVGKLQQNWKHVSACTELTDTRNEISSHIWGEIRTALERAAVAQSLFGQDLVDGLACNFMVAFPFEDAQKLIVFDKSAQSLEVTLSSPFFSIGSGHFQADPFLAFVKRIFWSNSAPKTLTDGIFCVLWTLDHVSRVNAGLGVGGDPNVFILSKVQDAWQAERVEEDFLGEQLIALQAAEDALRNFRYGFSPESTGYDPKQYS